MNDPGSQVAAVPGIRGMPHASFALWAILLAACHPMPGEVPEVGVTLGWRLAPGMTFTYQYLSTYRFSRDEVTREETWTYLVRDIDDLGVYSIDGRLLNLDASITHDGRELTGSLFRRPLREEKNRLEGLAFHMALSMDGRLDRLEAGEWSDSLPHRLLALSLPVDAVKVGDRWADLATARPFVDLYPSGEPVQVTGESQMESLNWAERRQRGPGGGLPFQLIAMIRTGAAILPGNSDVPALDMSGFSEWNMDDGMLDFRSLSVRERGGGAEEGESFVLELHRTVE